MKCIKCGKVANKDGLQKNGNQRYRCKSCNFRFQSNYVYNACKPLISEKIVRLIKEGMGIKNISRYLKISATTVMKRIKQIASKIKSPIIYPAQDTYEVDEMYSFLGNKGNQCWLMYAISREQKQVVHFEVGGRTKDNAQKVIDNLVLRQAKKIYTDKLAMYRSLVPPLIHSTRHRQTNHIERHNLNLRTNCKRFGRRSICYSKSILMLKAVLKIFFWG